VQKGDRVAFELILKRLDLSSKKVILLEFYDLMFRRRTNMRQIAESLGVE